MNDINNQELPEITGTFDIVLPPDVLEDAPKQEAEVEASEPAAA